MRVHRHASVASFVDRAQRWLMRAEVENHLMLSICRQLPAPIGPDVYLATVEDAGQVVACGLRTPPYKAVITRGEGAALAALAEDLFDRYGALPAVLGPEPEVATFARLWSEHTGSVVARGRQQRVLEIREVPVVAGAVEGTMRLAGEDDRALVAAWIAAFNTELALPAFGDPADAARVRIAHQQVFLWVADRPVSMAAGEGELPGGAGVSLVYTPPALRGRGYASACVAELTRHLLARQHPYCCLFTDLANATSNDIYQRIGYRPVCDMTDVMLGA